MANSGLKIYAYLIEVNDRTGQPTGRIKNNLATDPDYIPPVEDLTMCPLVGANDGFPYEFPFELS